MSVASPSLGWAVTDPVNVSGQASGFCHILMSGIQIRVKSCDQPSPCTVIRQMARSWLGSRIWCSCKTSNSLWFSVGIPECPDWFRYRRMLSTARLLTSHSLLLVRQPAAPLRFRGRVFSSTSCRSAITSLSCKGTTCVLAAFGLVSAPRLWPTDCLSARLIISPNTSDWLASPQTQPHQAANACRSLANQAKPAAGIMRWTNSIEAFSCKR